MPTFHHQRLPNGLTILAECVPQAHTAAVGFFVRTGARDENRSIMGVSHFLEHMMFKGTARRSAADVNREFDELGADYNAFTSHEATIYYAHVLPEFLPRVIDLLGDMLRPALRENDFTVEKNVILEEIGMYEDRPQSRLNDLAAEAYYCRHPLGFRVLGTVESITAMTVEQMRGYFQSRYAADNVIVSAAGKVDFARLVDDVSKIAGGWSPALPVRDCRAPQPADNQLTQADARLNRCYIAMMCPGPGAQDDRRYAASVLTDVLGAPDGSRFYWALIDPGLADEADFALMAQDHTGTYLAYASCAPERAGEVEKIMLKALADYETSVDVGEIERAKNKLATQMTLRGEQPMGRMLNLGGHWMYLNEYSPLEEELRRLREVTPDHIRKLLHDMPFTPQTIVRLRPDAPHAK